MLDGENKFATPALVADLRKEADASFPYDVDMMNILDGVADRIESAWVILPPGKIKSIDQARIAEGVRCACINAVELDRGTLK